MIRPTFLTVCPRCGTKAFEHLSSHSHCMECLYFEDRYYDYDTALITALRAEKILKQLDQNKSKKEKLKPIIQNYDHDEVSDGNNLTDSNQNSSKEAS